MPHRDLATSRQRVTVAVMCGRYRFKDPKLIAEAVKAVLGGDLTMAEFLQRWNVAPSQFLPVAHAHDGVPRVEAMRWGLVPFWEKSEKPKLAPINARSEEAYAKPMFRQSIQRRRCLVPADAFYEWKRVDEKTKIPFCIARREERPFFFAGLFESAVEGLRPATYTLLTTAPNALVASIHDRMPVLLDGERARAWVRPGALTEPEFRAFCTAYPAEDMVAWRISSLVNNPRNEAPEVALRVE
ncbi:MAG: SOS response-associated peptidase [Opitutaceae bacterium]